MLTTGFPKGRVDRQMMTYAPFTPEDVGALKSLQDALAAAKVALRTFLARREYGSAFDVATAVERGHAVELTAPDATSDGEEDE